MASYTTIRKITSDLHKSLKQTFDDAEISFNQVAHWVQFFVNKFQALKIEAIDSGLYLSIYTDIPVLTATADTNPNIVAGRKYIVLPSAIHDFNSDGGIKYISYTDFDDSCQPSFAGVRFTRTSPTKAKRLYFNPYETPKPNNPYYYRIRNYVYLLGIEDVGIRYLEAGLYTTFDPFSETSLDIALYLDEGLLADVYKNVFELGRFVMLIPSDVINEGADSTNPQVTPKQRVVSVNPQETYKGGEQEE